MSTLAASAARGRRGVCAPTRAGGRGSCGGTTETSRGGPVATGFDSSIRNSRGRRGRPLSTFVVPALCAEIAAQHGQSGHVCVVSDHLAELDQLGTACAPRTGSGPHRRDTDARRTGRNWRTDVRHALSRAFLSATVDQVPLNASWTYTILVQLQVCGTRQEDILESVQQGQGGSRKDG